MRRIFIGIPLFLTLTLSAVVAEPPNEAELKRYYQNGGTDFSFQLPRGENETNYFLRQGFNQSHTVLSSGERPQILTAFPAGNSSLALFPVGRAGLRISMLEPPKAVSLGNERGVRYKVNLNQDSLEIEQAIAGSTRDVRDYEHSRLKHPDAQVTPLKSGPRRVLFSRPRLDGKGRYWMQLTLVQGEVAVEDSGKVHLSSSGHGDLQIGVEAFTSEPADAPLPISQIFKSEVVARMRIEDIQASLYLMNSAKSLAGSWRYQTFFGRDPEQTKIYLEELMEAQPYEIELAAIFERMSPAGESAHEEDIGDIATRRNIQAGRGKVSTPTYDYKMIDTLFLLPALFDIYVKKAGEEQAANFLERKTTGGRSYREALRANHLLILKKTEAFALRPMYRNLISFKEGEVAGDWRDSGNGHGATTDQEEAKLKSQGIQHDRTSTGGRYSFGVNVALVPSALRVVAKNFRQKRFGFYESGNAERAAGFLKIWEAKVRPLFEQRATALEATRTGRIYLAKFGLPPPRPFTGDFHYSALSLDAEGKPIRVIHSDEGFDLLLNSPPENVLQEVAGHLLRPFPYGLMLPVGMAVANPILVKDPAQQARFAPTEYHGFLVWGAEMAKMERGLAKQLKRADISETTRNKLQAAHRNLWRAIEEARPHLKEELWSWKVEEERLVYVPYKEANALQFWNLALVLLENPYKTGPASAVSGLPSRVRSTGDFACMANPIYADKNQCVSSSHSSFSFVPFWLQPRFPAPGLRRPPILRQ